MTVERPSLPARGRAGLVFLVPCAALLGLAALLGMFFVPYPAAHASSGGAAPTVAPVPGLPPPQEPRTGANPPAAMAGDGMPSTAVPPASERFTEEVVDTRILSRPLSKWSMLVLRFGAAIAGLVVLILWASMRRDLRKGLLPPLPTRPLAVQPFGVAAAVGVSFSWFVGGSLVALAVHAIRRGPAAAPPTELNVLGMCVVSLPVGIWVVLRARRLRPLQGTDAVPVRASLRIGALGYLVSAAIVLLLSVVMAVVLTLLLREPPELQGLVKEVLESPSPLPAILITVLGVVVAPFAEEAVFRGTLYPAARSLLGVRPAAIAVSALFGAIHGNLLASVPLFGLALLLTWCYERTGSILSGVIVHAASNAASLIPLLLAR